MITKIKLVNWRSHLNSEIDFSEGTNVFTGIMGSGKSSITNAICFGLFGTFPELQMKKLKMDEIIMSKPNQKDKAEVTITFNLDGEEYSVFRAIERGKGTTYAELRKGETLLDAPQSQRVTEQIQNLLKIDYELFSKAIYSEQNGLDYFLRLSRGERMKRIDNLLMIDKYEKARSSAVTLKNKVNERKLAKQSLIDQVDLSTLDKTTSEIKNDIKEITENQKHLKLELNRLKTKSTELEKQLKTFESTEKEFNELQQQKKSIETSIKENLYSIEEIKRLLKGRGPKEIENRLLDSRKHLEYYKKELDEYLEQQEKLVSLNSEYSTKIQYINKEIENLQKEVWKKTESKKKLSTLKLKYVGNPSELLELERKNLEKVNNEFAILENRLEDLKNIIIQIENLVDECPLCNSKIGGDKKSHLIKERANKIFETEKTIKLNQLEKKKLTEQMELLGKAVQEFTELSFEAKDLEAKENNLKELESSYREFKIELHKIEEEFNKIKKNISELQNVTKKLELEISELDIVNSRSKELESREDKIANHRLKLQDIEKNIFSLTTTIEKTNIMHLRNLYEETISKKSVFKTKIDAIDEILAEKEHRLEELESKQKQAKKQIDEIKYLENLIQNLAVFEKALSNTQVQLRKEFIDTVNYTMNDIWSDIYPYADFSAIRLAIEEGDYVLQLHDRTDKWVDVEGIASGGERSISALVLRIAFSLVLTPQLKWLILDEPTTNLDSKAVEDLAETLRNRIGEFISQVFLITHDKTLENAATGELYRLYRNKETDGTTVLERVTDV